MTNQMSIDDLFGGPARPAGRVRTARRPAAPRANPVASNDNLRGNDIQVVITPSNFERRTDRNGKPYAWVRGVLTYRKTEKVRTVMVQGEAYHLIQHLLGVGTSLKISGFRETIVNKATGAKGGEIFRAKDVLKVYDAEGREIDGTNGRLLAGHERQGHYRRQHHGPANSLVKIVWVDDVKVNGGREAA